MVKRFIPLFLLIFTLLNFAQYKFEILRNFSTIEIEKDSSVIVHYSLTFKNHGAPIDIVDIGLPDENYILSTAKASINGKNISDIRKSTVLQSGVEIHLKENAIPPNSTQTLDFSIVTKKRIYEDDLDKNYASIVFMTTYFGKEYTLSTTKLGFQIIFPEGVKPNEVRYHKTKFTEAFIDNRGRVVYRWIINDASPSQGYVFGASFPKAYVSEVIRVTPLQKILNSLKSLFFAFLSLFFNLLPCFCIFTFIGLTILGIIQNRKRMMQYLPPSVGMDGVEIRRGLTVPEVAVLMEEPLPKVLLFIIFGMVKKGYIEVISKTPFLKLKKKGDFSDSDMDNMLSYEKELLKAINDDNTINQNEARDILIDLIKRVQSKMKGFSRKKTLEYYKSIIKKAYDEVKNENFEESFEWLLLDKELRNEIPIRFGSTAIRVPSYVGTVILPKESTPTSSHTPSYLDSLITSANNFVTAFENFSNTFSNQLPALATKVTEVTNPPPPTHTGGSGGGCACACACAGCACACAGGGR